MIRSKAQSVKSINSQVELVEKATSFMDLTSYGKVMLGNKGFEFYDQRDVAKNIQIPWSSIVRVKATVFFKGKWIPRYLIETKEHGSFIFSSKNPKKVLAVMGKYIGKENLVHALGMWDVLKRAFTRKASS